MSSSPALLLDEEEERILSALAEQQQMTENEEEVIFSRQSSYRPKARGLTSMYEVPALPPRGHKDRRTTTTTSTTKGKQHKKGKVKRRRKVAKATIQSSMRNSDDDTVRGEAASVSTTILLVPSSSSVPVREEAQQQDDSPANNVESQGTKTVQDEVNATVLPITTSTKPVSIQYPNTMPSKPISAQHQHQHQPSAPRIDDSNNRRTRPLTPTLVVGNAVVSSTTPWVRRYLNARPKDVLLPVPKEYIADGFNLAQLAPIVERIGFQVLGAQAVEIAKRLVEIPTPQPSYPIYRLALQLLLCENEAQEATILQHPLIPPEAIQQAAEALYLLVHARFVTSPRGLDALRRILLNSPVFGKCPRLPCDGAMLLPHGACNDYTGNAHACQRYCPSCGNLWNCWESKTDGCAWGPSLCYLLLLAHGHELYPMANRKSRPPPRLSLVSSSSGMIHHHPSDPSIFGFRIYPAATWGRPLTG